MNFPEIPEDLIAQTPLPERDQARFLVFNRGDASVRHRLFQDLPEYLAPGDALVLNDVKVLPARLTGQKKTGGRVTVLLLAKYPDGERWTALVTPRPRLGMEIFFESGTARVLENRPDGEWVLGFSDRPLEGAMPLPPYIRRPQGVTGDDQALYQTVYAQERKADGGDGPSPLGAVAAPTAGLHFTPALLDRIRAQGVRVCSVTLWVGWGTFRPIAGDYRNHKMLPEPYQVPKETVEAIAATRRENKKVWAVGTTAVRTLESSVDDLGRLRSGVGLASLFITPGYSFRAVDRLVTNFHLSSHTPLLLTAAFAGEDALRSVYQTAILEKYRFLSYGDAMAVL